MTSNGGLILVRELDERLGLSELIDPHLTDPRGKNTQLPLADLLRQSVYSRLAGYEDVNDAECLSQDPTLRLIVFRKDLGPWRRLKGHKWGNFVLYWCGWQIVGSTSDENRFTVSRTSETDVLWRCFQSRKGNSGLYALSTG